MQTKLLKMQAESARLEAEWVESMRRRGQAQSALLASQVLLRAALAAEDAAMTAAAAADFEIEEFLAACQQVNIPVPA